MTLGGVVLVELSLCLLWLRNLVNIGPVRMLRNALWTNCGITKLNLRMSTATSVYKQKMACTWHRS